MKYDLCDSFYQFFQEHGIIEFESVLSAKDLSYLSHLVELERKDAAIDPWNKAYNTWSSLAEIQKILSKSAIGEIASFLYKKKPIRLGYVQTICTNFPSPFTKDLSLEEISSMTPIVGGALLCLSSPVHAAEKTDIPLLCSPQTGRMFFFSARTAIPFPELYTQSNVTCLLLCFVSSTTRYRLCPLDVHTHFWKRMGYVFGDLLRPEHVPFLCH